VGYDGVNPHMVRVPGHLEIPRGSRAMTMANQMRSCLREVCNDANKDESRTILLSGASGAWDSPPKNRPSRIRPDVADGKGYVAGLPRKLSLVLFQGPHHGLQQLARCAAHNRPGNLIAQRGAD
jgi:hypothetical protein